MTKSQTDIVKVCEELRRRGIPCIEGEPMSGHTSFRIGGAAAVFCSPRDAAGVAAALGAARGAGVPCCVLGNGSNVLFPDDGYAGVVVSARALNAVRVGAGAVTAGAGAFLGDVCEAARGAGLCGLEFAYGIPGSVGGAVFMNAGAFGGDMAQVLREVSFLDENLREQRLPARELELAYRGSVFQRRDWVILEAVFELRRGEVQAIAELMDANMRARAEKQPLDLPSAGSAFKRPQGAFAGELIDRCGLRGARVGGAAVSEKHAGFIVNTGGATCADVLALAERVQAAVLEKTGHSLEREIRVLAAAGGGAGRKEGP